MGVEIKGFQELMADIQRMGDQFADAGGEDLSGIVKAGAEPILAQAKLNVHSVSGDLVKSLKTIIRKKGSRIKARIGAHKGGKGFYATMVEYGHRGPHPAGPHPFLAPAYDAKVEEAFNTIKTGLSDKLKQ
jgi:HK97 gp10 family phage protein